MILYEYFQYFPNAVVFSLRFPIFQVETNRF